ncbi:MAG: HD domain-containing phosphohydrolase [Bacteroidales bacterium]
MDTLSLPARLYVTAVIVAGACTLVAFTEWTNGLENPLLFFSLLLVSTLTSAFKVKLPFTRNDSTMSVSYAVDFASLLLMGPNPTMLIAALGGLTQSTVRQERGKAARSDERNPVHKILFSMATLVLTVQAAGYVLFGLKSRFGPHWTGFTAAVIGSMTAYYLVNTGLVAAAVALSQRTSVVRVWRDSFLFSAPGYFLGGVIAQVTYYLVGWSNQYFVLIASLPLYLTYRAYQMYLERVEQEHTRVEDISNLHLTTVEALALAIDAKDQRAHSHIRRMQVYARTLGERFGMTPQEQEGLRTAALLHDIGKLAVPEHILSKPGALTEDEVKKVRMHPVVGAEIIAQVPFPYPVAPLILSHHERWDGRGYPAGLKGEQIPLGARILAVADFYDALISDRPYHPAMSPEAAAQLVGQEAGKSFDPKVAEKFLEALPEMPSLVEASSPSLLTPRVIAGLSPDSAKPADEQGVLEDIATAHREIHGLYEIAQALGTSLDLTETMKIIASKLTALVPFSALAVYLCEPEGDTLTCRFATGTDADALQRLVVRNGHGLTGWVARNRKPLVNARPDADLDASDQPASPTRLRSALIAPLVFNDEVIGTLAVYHTESGFYREDHARLLERVSEQAAAVIANSIVFERTQKESLTDPLTALPNTRHLTLSLERELARAERLKSEVVFIVMDLDDFKVINDHYGHQVGDRALQKVASVLRGATRPYDICVRYAGDEFIVVLPGCPAAEADTRVRALQTAIEAARFEARPGKVIELSMSGGAAVYPVDGGGYDSLLAIADARMYRDKTRRKKSRTQPVTATERDAAAALSETDLRRAAMGIL